ncbi:hypothetical protein [Prosthecomicrobium sp. N25]|uniref:hypothetical protein n=1 Tax=Prosthecomicrobium sp. N25 TaxID=3129254 RepID=UPI0030768CF7
MIVTLDLTRLLADGKISREEHDRLAALGTVATGSLVFNILVGFGVIAVAAGIIALVPDATTGVVVGGALLALGLGVTLSGAKAWGVLAGMCTLVGALVLGGGVVILTEAAPSAFLGITVAFAVLGVLARSGLLVALAVLALSSAFGARTGYEHATYFLGIEEPTVTIVLFSVVALGSYLASRAVPAAYERLGLIAARTALFMVNFGFWIGSLWGDGLGVAGRIPAAGFAIAWALGLLGLGAWGYLNHRRWVVNLVAVFGAIHFYTQWFEKLGANPLSVLVGGLTALGFALALRRFNRDWVTE